MSSTAKDSVTAERIIEDYAKSSPLNYGAWADQTDFKPEVKRLCSAHKENSRNPHFEFSSSFSRRSAKVIIIGAPGVGKTSLVLRYCRDIFERNYKTTIGVDFEVEKYKILGVPFHMQIWDTAGADRFKGVTTAYFRGAQVVVVAFDLTSIDSLYRTEEWLQEAQEHCNVNNFEVFLIATKRDLVSDWACSEMEKKAEEFADKYGAEYWSTSSRTGENIEEVFTRISVVAFESVLMREIKITASTAENGQRQLESSSSLIKLKKPTELSSKKKKNCCSR
ncbi:ras-related protein Rab-34-like [Halichondria panicea]|uniref:ras-related protein Rab-34-like n=1 Tax=Halichondria panicea TaxID=6063 RepID=UPI00312BB12A